MHLFPAVGELYQLMLCAGMGSSHAQNLISRAKLARRAAWRGSNPLNRSRIGLKKPNYSDLKSIIESRGIRNVDD